ncbi:UNKNOWN [Stylonychia lemnae]|uniref:Uncharacterized protein n=1 Tax=Stylonychia lemnae TaxID=5949 RepID=A0A078BC26_STYLE|nr:UNKNOWN [Stylonychia lemnae]|eukprot:CDW91153.1 UNKNOWN [Stylonychia lemnae]
MKVRRKERRGVFQRVQILLRRIISKLMMNLWRILNKVVYLGNTDNLNTKTHKFCNKLHMRIWRDIKIIMAEWKLSSFRTYKKRSVSRIASKKISNNSAKRNFPADFFAKRNNESRCGSQQRLNSQESNGRISNSSSRQFADAEFTQNKASRNTQQNLEQPKLPMIGRNQSAPMLQALNIENQNQKVQPISITNQRQNQLLQSSQENTKKRVKSFRKSIQSEDCDRYKDLQENESDIYNSYKQYRESRNLFQTEIGSPLMEQMHILKKNCDKIIFSSGLYNQIPIHEEDSPKMVNHYEKRKMSQPERSHRVEPLRQSMNKHYDEYKNQAVKQSLTNNKTLNVKNQKLPSILPELQQLQKDSTKIKDPKNLLTPQTQHKRQSPLKLSITPNENSCDPNDSLVSTSRLVPVQQQPLLNIPDHLNIVSKQQNQQMIFHVNKGGQVINNSNHHINIVPGTPLFNPLKQSAESVVSLMSNGTIGSINIQNVQSIHIHNNVNATSMQLNGLKDQFKTNPISQNMIPQHQSMQTLKTDGKEELSQSKVQLRQQRYNSSLNNSDKQMFRSKSKDQQQSVQNRIQIEIKSNSKDQKDQIQLTKIKKSMITVPGNQDDVIQRIQAKPNLIDQLIDNRKSQEQQQMIYLSQLNVLHEKRQELSTPQFNEPRQTLKSFNAQQIQIQNSPQTKNPFESASQMLDDQFHSPQKTTSAFFAMPQQYQKQGSILERKDFLKRIQSQQAFFEDSNNEGSTYDKKSSQGSERPSHLSQQNTHLNNIFGLEKQVNIKQGSDKKKLLGKKKKVMLMHQLNSVTNSGNASGLTSSKNSNRPSQASYNNDVSRQNSHGIGDSIFEKAALLLQQYNSIGNVIGNANELLPPRPNVTFCNIKEEQQESINYSRNT